MPYRFLSLSDLPVYICGNQLFFMKRISIVLLALILAGTARSQVMLGVKAGLNLSKLSLSDGSGTETSFKTNPNFNAGLLVHLPLAHGLSIQPEVFYSAQGAKFDDEDISAKINLAYVNVPVLFKFQHSSGLFAELGPQIGFLVSAKDKEEGTSVSIKDNVKSTDFSGVVGIGYKIPVINLGIDVRYALGLTNVDKTSGEDNEKLKNRVFSIDLFYMFGGK